MSYHITWFLLRCWALCNVIKYISSVKEVSSITDCEVRHPLLVDASYEVKKMLLRSHLKSELLKSWHLFLQPGFIFALSMQELVVSSFAYITNDNDQDRLIHANQTLKNFELSLSLFLTRFIWKLNMYWAFHVHTDFSVCSKDDDNCVEIFSAMPLQLLFLL